MKRKVAIVGVADMIGKIYGDDIYSMFAKLLKKATYESGITKNDIDGIITCQSMYNKHSRLSTALAEYVGITNLKWADSVNLGAQSNGTMFSRAASAIREGTANTIVIASVDLQLTGLSKDLAIKMMAELRHPEYEQPYGLFMPAIMALRARKYIDYYKLDSDVFVDVSVAMRKHANLNQDNVYFKDLISREDVLISRMIADPLKIYDCAPVVDGGAVLIMTTEEKARDLKKKPVFYYGGGENYAHDFISQTPDLLSTPIKLSVDRAFERVDIKKSDIDILYIHDAFSPIVVHALEDFGVCEKGEGWKFVRDGNIDISGKLPVNTNGGLLSQGHPGYPGGLLHVTEAIRQLRGECGKRQVKDVQFASSIHFGGPLSMAHTSIWGVK